MELSNRDIETALGVLEEGAVSPVSFMRKCGVWNISYANALRIAKLLLDAGIIYPITIGGRITAYTLNELPK